MLASTGWAAGIRLQPFKAAPDRVLVLFNADYTKDVDGSLPGQDSREVAEYYVQRHTDPDTGKKPHVLGLSCRHGKQHLNHWFIKEKSQDNKNGLVFTGTGQGPGPDEWARDSRKVEVVVEPGGDDIDWGSLRIWCRPLNATETIEIEPTVSGIPHKQKRRIVYPEVEEGKGRCYRFDAHAQVQGTLWVYLKVRDQSGRVVRDVKLKYYDRDDFVFSSRGADGIADELHVQEDVIIPVKEYLEDPANELPDGTSLRERILYMVICHGLPYSCDGAFGIEHSPRAQLHSRGDLISLEQKLQTLYYGWGRELKPPVISIYLPGGPDAQQGVRNHRIVTAMRYSLIGRDFQPYMHPDAYSFLRREEPRFVNLPPFASQRFLTPPYFFAYGLSRLDGQGPETAKRQIDSAVYASRYLRPEMDPRVRQALQAEGKKTITDLAERMRRVEQEGTWGRAELQALGFRTWSKRSLPFLARPAEEGYPEKMDEQYTLPHDAGYYPGGMDIAVASGNGWNMGRHRGIWRQVDQGVSVSSCGGPAYGGGPHITNATFFDPRILLRYLFRGRDLGECFLRSTVYVNWSTSLLGDPLLHPDLHWTRVDTTPPRAEQKKITTRLYPVLGGYAGTMTVPLVTTAQAPELARLELTCRRQGESRVQTSHQPLYSVRPQVVLRNLEPEATYLCRPVLIDPYGNRRDLAEASGPLLVETGPAPQQGMLTRDFKKSDTGWSVDLIKAPRFNASGSVLVEFRAGERGLIPSIRSRNLSFTTKNWHNGRVQGRMQLAGVSRRFFFHSPLAKGEQAGLILRWRRHPLTREVLLVAADGTEFCLAADVRTPWEAMTVRSPFKVTGPAGVKILSASIRSNARPASDMACAVTVPDVKREAWLEANGAKAGTPEGPPSAFRVSASQLPSLLASQPF